MVAKSKFSFEFVRNLITCDSESIEPIPGLLCVIFILAILCFYEITFGFIAVLVAIIVADHLVDMKLTEEKNWICEQVDLLNEDIFEIKNMFMCMLLKMAQIL